jgi:hypothetical protein
MLSCFAHPWREGHSFLRVVFVRSGCFLQNRRKYLGSCRVSGSLSALRRKFDDVFYAAIGNEAFCLSLAKRLCKS